MKQVKKFLSFFLILSALFSVNFVTANATTTTTGQTVYVVSLGDFKTQKEADAMVAKAKSLKFNPEELKFGAIYRVIIGSSATKETADKLVASAKEKGLTASIFTDKALIKGNINKTTKAKIYHVPGSTYYSRTIAEAWFYTTQEAINAGFRAPK